MILIKSVEFLDTGSIDPFPLRDLREPYGATEVLGNEGRTVLTRNEFETLVRGRRFVRPSDGTDIVIGVSEQAQEILGIQYEAWDEAAGQLESANDALSLACRELNAARVAPLWTRIKWVFLGYRNSS